MLAVGTSAQTDTFPLSHMDKTSLCLRYSLLSLQAQIKHLFARKRQLRFFNDG